MPMRFIDSNLTFVSFRRLLWDLPFSLNTGSLFLNVFIQLRKYMFLSYFHFFKDSGDAVVVVGSLKIKN